MKDFVDKIIAYEGGEMSEEEIIEFFQELVLSDKLSYLQGHYGRTAAALIQQGHIKSKDEYQLQLIIEEEQ